MLLKNIITLLALSFLCSCGNYSLLEKLGPSDDTAYLQMYDGLAKSFIVSTTDSTGTTATNTYNLVMLATNTGLGEEFLFSGNENIKKGTSLIQSKYGWQERFRIIDLFGNNITGAVADPEVIQYNFIEMPFISGNTSQESHLQIVSNYPTTLTSNSITVQISYEIEGKTLENNVNITINDIEYNNCIKYKFIIKTKTSALENADPYNIGDPISESNIESIYYLAPKIGIIKQTSLETKKKENNSSEQTLTTSTLIN